MSRLYDMLNNQPRIQPGHWLVLFSLIGFGLRLQQLSFQPLWGDEGWSFYFAMQSLPQLLALTAIDIHPPLYYILLKVWLYIIGSGPEAARFLSVIIGTLLIPVLGVLGRRLFDVRIGATAAAVVSAAPLAIYYSQEVRMYGLVTLLGAMSVYFFLRLHETGELYQQVTDESQSPVSTYGTFGVGRTDRKRWSIVYMVVTTAALYTMYYAIFIPLFQLLYTLLISFWDIRHSRRWAILAASLAPLVYVSLLYLPWIIYATPRLVSYVQNKRLVEGYLPLNIVRFFGDHFVAFSLGHLPATLQPYVWSALPFVIIASLGFVAALFVTHRRYIYLYLYLFLPLLIGFIINQIYPFTPPYFERTLLLAAPAYWLLIAVGLIWLWDRQFLLVGTVVMAMLVVTGVSLISFYTLPRYPNEDYRPLLRDIAARATAQDTLLTSYQWQLGFYLAYLSHPRPQLFTVPGWGQGWAGEAGHTQLTTDLADIFERSPRLWFPAHQALGHIWEDQTEAVIADVGYPALLQWYGPRTKLTLAGRPTSNLYELPPANFENRLTLLKAGVGSDAYEAGRGIVQVELVWRKEDNLGSEHRVSLRLVDADGHTWAIRDSYPRAGQAFFTDQTIGDTLTDHHGVIIPAGTPPGSYRLLLSLRRVNDAHPMDLLDAEAQPLGAELLLGQVEVVEPESPVGSAALPVQHLTNAIFGQDVRLVGYSLADGTFKAGQALPLNLFWESLADNLEPLTVSVQLQDRTGQEVVGYEQVPVWPTERWRQGSLLRDPHAVFLPPNLPPGEYQIVIGLITLQQTRLNTDGSDHLLLAKITTIDRPHIFETPEPQIPLVVIFGDQAKLIGLDLPHSQVKAGERLPLTLYWQATATFDKSWTVFVHLINKDGQIIGQQDQVPGGGQFPTTSWLPDEYLVDTYDLLVPADTPAGKESYWLEIGLYDTNDFSRLPVVKNGAIVGNHIVLERWPISIE